jgi:uncharacterized protein YndB with AHSA1/START domain
VITDEQIDIDAPTASVWDVMSDVRRWPEWTASVSSVEALGDGALEVGARFRVRQPRLPQAVWEVTEIVPGRSFTWVNRSPGLTSTGTHAVDPDGPGASAATLRLEQIGGLAFLVRPFSRRTRRYVAMEADGLKRRSEHLAASGYRATAVGQRPDSGRRESSPGRHRRLVGLPLRPAPAEPAPRRRPR